MKARDLLISLVACVSCTAIDANAAGYVVHGFPTCGEWIEARQHSSHLPFYASQAQESWVLGFLSGNAAGAKKNFLDGTDYTSLFQWISNYCRDNPLNTVADASNELAAELIKRKGL
ncbi:hypothetical protein F0160_21085 [Paraburkholderia sp. JPY303]|uniref:hypothetical protein n=1 Tax=Paraburkholderia atlantica TaxID=2654982 RepID=UPI001591CE5C|nr:hypothetical protein [Paraburkholderia atlantica]NUY32984.1 hypothetical protein [Paraburkholderia atlantica]